MAYHGQVTEEIYFASVLDWTDIERPKSRVICFCREPKNAYDFLHDIAVSENEIESIYDPYASGEYDISDLPSNRFLMWSESKNPKLVLYAAAYEDPKRRFLKKYVCSKVPCSVYDTLKIKTIGDQAYEQGQDIASD